MRSTLSLLVLSLTLSACVVEADTAPRTTESVLCADTAPETRDARHPTPTAAPGFEPTTPRYVLVGPAAGTDPECGEIRVEFWADLDTDPYVDAATVAGAFYPGSVFEFDAAVQERIGLIVGLTCHGENSGGPWHYLELIE